MSAIELNNGRKPYFPKELRLEKDTSRKSEESNAVSCNDEFEISKPDGRLKEFPDINLKRSITEDLAQTDNISDDGCRNPVDTSETPFISRAVAGAMIGATVLTALAYAGTPSPSALTQTPMVENAETPSITRILEDNEISSLSYKADKKESAAQTGIITVKPDENLSLRDNTTGSVQRVTRSTEKCGTYQYENVEIFDALRIDIIRNTVSHTEKPPEASSQSNTAQNPVNLENSVTTGSTTTTTTKTEKKELSPFGIDLGNGLFFDINGNLTFNPLRMNEDYRKISINPYGLFNSTSVTRHDNSIRIDPPGLLNSTDVKIEKGKIIIDPAGPWNSTVIEQDDEHTVITPPGLYGLMGSTKIEESKNKVYYNPPGIFNKTVITKVGERTHISIPGWDNDVTISKNANITEISYPGWFNNITVTKNGNKTIIDPPGLGNSIVITRNDNRIIVNPPGLGNHINIDID